MKAAEKNLTEIALALISAGADVNIADKVRKLFLCGDLGYYFSFFSCFKTNPVLSLW